jgi:hypothetical protein
LRQGTRFLNRQQEERGLPCAREAVRPRPDGPPAGVPGGRDADDRKRRRGPSKGAAVAPPRPSGPSVAKNPPLAPSGTARGASRTARPDQASASARHARPNEVARSAAAA